MSTWNKCRNILCVRLDNMGDLLMSGPAIKAVKEAFQSNITVLTSSKAKGLANVLPFIDEVMVFDSPWMKLPEQDRKGFMNLVENIRMRNFDGCIIFTVYSQNPMPAILLAYLAGIPLRLAYCRENPYDLLTDWLPDPEPYSVIRHQVRRDLKLVESIGALSSNDDLDFPIDEVAELRTTRKLSGMGIKINMPFLVFHCGVSEPKRQFPAYLWIQAANLAAETFGWPILFTGSAEEISYIRSIQSEVSAKTFLLAGELDLNEFAVVLNQAQSIVSVNTGTIHLAAALKTPLVVLYARSNPQHTPWNVPHRVLEYSIPDAMKSRNEIIRYVDDLLYSEHKDYPSSVEICESIKGLLSSALKTV